MISKFKSTLTLSPRPPRAFGSCGSPSDDACVVSFFFPLEQNCITDLVTCPAWGGVEKATKVASAGLDGRLCFWDLTSPTLEAQFAKLSVGAQVCVREREFA